MKSLRVLCCLALAVAFSERPADAPSDTATEFAQFVSPLPARLSFPPEMPASVRADLQKLLASPEDEALPARLRSRLDARSFSKHISVPRVYRRDGEVAFVFGYVDQFYYLAETNQHEHVMSAFGETGSEPLWIKLLMTVSDVTGVPVSAITGVGIDAGCRESDRGFVWMSGGALHRVGQRCWKVASVSQRVTFLSGAVTASASTTLQAPRRASFSRVTDLTQAFFRHLNAVPVISDRSEHHLVVGAHGLRNVVVRGENLWEKVSFYIAEVAGAEDAPLNLFIVSDGYFTASVGAAPPVTSYTNPLETKYYKQLEEFAQSLVEYLRRNLSPG